MPLKLNRYSRRRHDHSFNRSNAKNLFATPLYPPPQTTHTNLVSIAQTRKTSLPLSRIFQSYPGPWCFNRSNAKNLFATLSLHSCKRVTSQFQSLKREKPLCHSPTRLQRQMPQTAFQSLKREKPLCHVLHRNHLSSIKRVVSIAQTRKTSLPLHHKSLMHHCFQCFNRSNAKNLFATLNRRLDRFMEQCMFQSLKREKPLCHVEFTSLPHARNFLVSIAQTRKTSLPPRVNASKHCVLTRFNRSNAKNLFATQAIRPPSWEKITGFNRSNAKNLFATTLTRLQQSNQLSFNRSNAKNLFATCNYCRFVEIVVVTFQSLKREKPLCHSILRAMSGVSWLVSIAQTRKTSLPLHVLILLRVHP